jgi:pyrimidine 5'-nucleotidase
MSLTTIFIDLDDTIYPHTSGVWSRIRSRIDQYMREVMGFAPVEADNLRREMVERYGTTLRGLQTIYHVDEAAYLAYVHDVPVEDLLQPNPSLRQTLQAIPQRKLIFTNADINHARRVLIAMNMLDCFEGIIDIHRLAPYCKPMPEAYHTALEIAGESDPNRCLLVDDLPVNLDAARSLGFQPLLVRNDGRSTSIENDHVVICDLTELPQVIDARGVVRS